MTLRERLLRLTEVHQVPGVADLFQTFGHPDLLDGAVTEPAALERPAPELTDLLQQIARRGFDPLLVPALLGHFEGRPLERGVVAWDILCGTVCAQAEGKLLGELRAAAEAIDEISAIPTARCFDLNRYPSTELIVHYAAGAVKDPIEEMKRNGLGAIDQLLHKGGRAAESVKRETFRAGLTSLGRLYAHAHLPSLATLYFDYAIRALGHRDVLPLLCETMFDAGATERIPRDAIVKGNVSDEEWIDFTEYLIYRTHEGLGSSITAYGILETNRRNRGASHVPTARFTIMQGHLAPLFGDAPPPLARVDEIAQRNELWKLAWAVRIAASAHSSERDSGAPLDAAHDFVARFGHDWRAWYHAFRTASHRHGADTPWKLASVRAIGHEILSLPHEPNAWKGLVLLIADEHDVNVVLEEIDAYLYDQSEF